MIFALHALHFRPRSESPHDLTGAASRQVKRPHIDLAETWPSMTARACQCSEAALFWKVLVFV